MFIRILFSGENAGEIGKEEGEPLEASRGMC